MANSIESMPRRRGMFSMVPMAGNIHNSILHNRGLVAGEPRVNGHFLWPFFFSQPVRINAGLGLRQVDCRGQQ